MRRAQEEDLDDMIRMGRKFHSEAGLPATFDPESFRESMRSMLDSPDALVIVSEHGMACAVSYNHWFNRDHKGCQELFWYAEPGHGMELLHAMEEWAIIQSSGYEGSLTMVARESLRPEELGRLYKRRGYVAQERTYTRMI